MTRKIYSVNTAAYLVVQIGTYPTMMSDHDGSFYFEWHEGPEIDEALDRALRVFHDTRTMISIEEYNRANSTLRQFVGDLKRNNSSIEEINKEINELNK